MSAHLCIAVHAGAGVHDPSLDFELKKTLRRTCRQSFNMLVRATSALDVVGEAIRVMEDDDKLNAGFGSNLTFDGRVECDAALMDGSTGDFGSAGAVSGVKNPIALARAILDHGRLPDPLGRVPPLTLVGPGAHTFATTNSVTVVPPESLIAPRALAEWRLWKRRLEAASSSRGEAVNVNDHLLATSVPNELQDTVGAVALDALGCVAAGVSSGGLLLKYPGRVGEAAVYGAGCWAAQEIAGNIAGRGVACSVSGTGEHIIKIMLARTIGDAISTSSTADPHQILRWALVDVFWKACRERGIRECNAGVLLLTREDDGEGRHSPRLWCAFTTTSMAIAYASSRNPTPKALVLRRPESSAPINDEKPPLYITALSL